VVLHRPITLLVISFILLASCSFCPATTVLPKPAAYLFFRYHRDIMSAFSTTSYYPFDSEAPAVFKNVQTNNYLNVAFLTLLLYDHAITLDKEVEWIWTLRWRLPKIVFFSNRYVICPLLSLNGIPAIIFPLSISYCNFDTIFRSIIPILTFCVMKLILVTRVGSLYGNGKFIIWSLRGLLASAVASSTVAQALIMRQCYAFLNYKFLPGCWITSTSSKPLTAWPMWAVFLSTEGFLVLLTAYKLLSYRNEMNKTVATLARDSIVYFIIIFACLVMDILPVVDRRITISVSIPTMCITSIAAGRMMMNIRGLIMEDPEDTVHLQTLQFATRNDADSQMFEEETEGEV